LTGPAGSGKTHLLNSYIKFLKDKHVEVGITASTGIAATHMGGTTIHSWTGMGIKDSVTRADISELKTRKYLRDRFSRTQVLVIDEVSMLHHFRLDLINQICQEMRDVSLPFGGMQVILCGDFFQLPPIARLGEPEAFFVYESKVWPEANFKICYLEEQHRQKDQDFLRILNEIRANNLSSESRLHLESRRGDLDHEPTRLHTHNANVDEINHRELEKLACQGREFMMTSRGNKNLVEVIKKSCLAPTTLKLKVGAKVMFVKNNFEEGFVNGTLAHVTGFDHEGPIVKTATGKTIHVKPTNWLIEEEGKTKASLTQYPLRLAWAITVHKSQGMSLDAVEVDLSKSFERGMGYVALSRVRSLQGLKILGLNENALLVRADVLDFDNGLRRQSNKHLAELLALSNEEKKSRQENFLYEIAPQVDKHGRVKKVKVNTLDETRKMFEAGMNLNEIASFRGLKTETVLDHLENILANDPKLDLRPLENEMSQTKFKKIYRAFNDIYGDNRDLSLSPVMKSLGGDSSGISYAELRLVRLFLKKRGL
jgi:hypothetical protein